MLVSLLEPNTSAQSLVVTLLVLGSTSPKSVMPAVAEAQPVALSAVADGTVAVTTVGEVAADDGAAAATHDATAQAATASASRPGWSRLAIPRFRARARTNMVIGFSKDQLDEEFPANGRILLNP